MIQAIIPAPVSCPLLDSALSSDTKRPRSHRSTSNAAPPTGRGFLFEIHGTEGDLAIVPADPRQATYIQVSEFTVRGAQAS